MFEAVSSPYLVPYDGTFRIRGFPTAPPATGPTGKSARKMLKERIEELDERQRMLAAQDRYSVLLIIKPIPKH